MSEGIRQGREMGEEEEVKVVCNSERVRERDLEREREERESSASVFQPGLCGPGGSSTARLDLEVIDRQH